VAAFVTANEALARASSVFMAQRGVFRNKMLFLGLSVLAARFHALVARPADFSCVASFLKM